MVLPLLLKIFVIPVFGNQRAGPLSYHMRLDSGQVWRKHVDQICQVTTPGFECGTSNLGSNHFSAEILLAVCESPSIGLSSETRYPCREHRPVQCFSFDT